MKKIMVIYTTYVEVDIDKEEITKNDVYQAIEEMDDEEFKDQLASHIEMDRWVELDQQKEMTKEEIERERKLYEKAYVNAAVDWEEGRISADEIEKKVEDYIKGSKKIEKVLGYNPLLTSWEPNF